MFGPMCLDLKSRKHVFGSIFTGKYSHGNMTLVYYHGKVYHGAMRLGR